MKAASQQYLVNYSGATPPSFQTEQIRNPLASSQRGTMDVRDWRNQAPRPLSRTPGNSFVPSPSAVVFRN
ncbi:hypothetical protein CEXT_238781 [Caerostris extrusa]|uniref:Uncharacterized protein n=1 Tax=Caerostris extrusa TaxID=172846 RepID=A0AAV4XK41_CAEEX|nr:hypothetical protein CEXT_238781 [Caerostris extrusa]